MQSDVGISDGFQGGFEAIVHNITQAVSSILSSIKSLFIIAEGIAAKS